MTFGEITDRLNFAAPDLSEPSSALRDRRDQMRVGSRRPFPFVGDDELHLHTTPPEPVSDETPVYRHGPASFCAGLRIGAAECPVLEAKPA